MMDSQADELNSESLAKRLVLSSPTVGAPGPDEMEYLQESPTSKEWTCRSHSVQFVPVITLV